MSIGGQRLGNLWSILVSKSLTTYKLFSNRCFLITFMRWVLPSSASSNDVSCISETKNRSKKTRCVIQTAKSVCFPSLISFFFVFVLFGGILTLLCSAILIQARRIVNGFWFPNGTTGGKSTIIIFYLSKEKIERKAFPFIQSIYVDLPQSYNHPSSRHIIKNAWKWTFERFCISNFSVSKTSSEIFGSCSSILCLSLRQVSEGGRAKDGALRARKKKRWEP